MCKSNCKNEELMCKCVCSTCIYLNETGDCTKNIEESDTMVTNICDKCGTKRPVLYCSKTGRCQKN